MAARALRPRINACSKLNGGYSVENIESENLVSGFKGEEGELIPLLQRVQERLGYISEEAVGRISRFLRISENQIFGVASFYSQFRFIPPGRNSVRVCSGTACHVRGGQILGETVERQLGISPGTNHSGPTIRFPAGGVPGLLCSRACGANQQGYLQPNDRHSSERDCAAI